MDWFTKEQFEDAILTFSKSLKLAGLSSYDKNVYDRPKISQGNFAYVVKFQESLKNGLKDVAIRAFRNPVDEMSEKRYQAIHKKIDSLDSEARLYFVDYKYLKFGLNIGDKSYPVIKMDWSLGDALHSWLKKNNGSNGSLRKLISTVNKLSSTLEKNKIAHGDIQPGNIFILDNGASIKLIDYDGMFVDELIKMPSSECGVRSFQHPERESKKPWSSNIDRFSFITLFLALETFIKKPGLIKDLDPASYFPFSPNDFKYPENSELLCELSKFPDLKQHIHNFTSVCRAPIESVPTLEDFIRGENIPKVIERAAQPAGVVSGDKSGRKEAHDYIPIYPVVNANDFAHAKNHQESMVEIIGRVVQLRQSSAGGIPWHFILFSSWDGFAVKLEYWPELHLKSKTPSSDIVNKWVSVTCWLGKISHGHINAKLDDFDSFHVISESEALWRLKKIPAKNEAAKTHTSQTIQNVPINPSTRNNHAAGQNSISGTNKSIFEKLFGWLE